MSPVVVVGVAVYLAFGAYVAGSTEFSDPKKLGRFFTALALLCTAAAWPIMIIVGSVPPPDDDFGW